MEKESFHTPCSILNPFLTIMTNITLGRVDWSIIYISPGIRNLITYIARSEWIDTKYIINRGRPFVQSISHREKSSSRKSVSQPSKAKQLKENDKILFQH